MGLGERQLLDPTSVPRDLHCSICLEVFDQPVFCGGRPCQHVFCRSCIESALEHKSECPTCRQTVAQRDLLVHQTMQSLVEAVHVRCTAKGCGWIGPLSSRSGHASECLAPVLENTTEKLESAMSKLDSNTNQIGSLESLVTASYEELAGAVLDLRMKSNLMANKINGSDEVIVDLKRELQKAKQDLSQLQEDVTALKSNAKAMQASVESPDTREEKNRMAKTSNQWQTTPLAPRSPLLSPQRMSSSEPLSARINFNPPREARGMDSETGTPLCALLDFEHAWSVVGDEMSNGVLVHDECNEKSPFKALRLAVGAHVQQLDLRGNMLHFRKLHGEGPDDGWASISVGGQERLQKLPQDASKVTWPSNTLDKPRSPICLLFRNENSSDASLLLKGEETPAVRVMREEATAILGYDVLSSVKNSWNGQTAPQPGDWAAAVFMADLAGLMVLWHTQPEVVIRPHAVLGFGTGELTALYAAGVLTFQDALRLVHFRSTLCDALRRKAGGGARVLVVGLAENQVEALCKQAKDINGEVCQISECLFRLGFTCAGTKQAVSTFKHLAEQAGALRVSHPESPAWYTPLMEPLQEKFNKTLDEILPRMKPPRCKLHLCATGGKPLQAGADPKVIVEHMRGHFVAPLLWCQAVQSAIDEGVDGFYIMGRVQGSADDLKDYMRHINKRLWKSTMEPHMCFGMS